MMIIIFSKIDFEIHSFTSNDDLTGKFYDSIDEDAFFFRQSTLTTVFMLMDCD